MNYLPARPKHIQRIDRYNTLRANWDFSLKFLKTFRKNLEKSLSSNVVTVAMAGSFGRLEGCTSSDADYILIVNDLSKASVKEDRRVLSETIRRLGAALPNKAGVFAEPRTVNQLIKNIGKTTESTDILGKRMLLLLESRPVFDDKGYEKVVSQIFNRYSEYVIREPAKEFVFLLNDLIRYFRFICVNYQSSFWRQNEQWPIRNLKLRHSRIIMYAGLLMLLGETSKYEDNKKIDLVVKALPWTPLDRIAWVYRQNKDQSFFRVAGLYDVFLSKLSDPDLRNILNNIKYDSRYSIPLFSELKANSDALVAELTRFIWCRRNQWSDRFFEYVIF
ncbi:MAG: hypothetical protein A3J39_00840 [Sulfuricurvum sp. RIFCSPHIGHO2_12_FULL_44_8]|nr:MAG: hypothetical protein A3J39_00840 [Sulfuricurvum sp. RIFCSPHIGHO2_12_FULL_44_8]